MLALKTVNVLGKRHPWKSGQGLTKTAHGAACRASFLMCGLSKVTKTMWHGCASEAKMHGLFYVNMLVGRFSMDSYVVTKISALI